MPLLIEFELDVDDEAALGASFWERAADVLGAEELGGAEAVAGVGNICVVGGSERRRKRREGGAIDEDSGESPDTL
jgi:hypothetical protein